MNVFTLTALMIFVLLTPNSFADKAAAILTGTEEGSKITGTVTFTDTEDKSGVQVQAQLAGLEPGLRGMHIHEKGSCEEKGEAAGPHFNPKNLPHGFLLGGGVESVHAGDLGNIQINQNGQGALFLVIPGLSVSGKEFGVAGKAVILHEKQDDFSQPAGNAGGRIACGVIKKVDEGFVPEALPSTESTPANEEEAMDVAEAQLSETIAQVPAAETPEKAVTEVQAVEEEVRTTEVPPVTPKKKKAWWQW